jgi:Ulp1 family protease
MSGPVYTELDAPLQKNGHDGIFVVWFAYVRSLDASFTLTSPGSTIDVTVSSKSRRQVVRVEDTAWAFAQHDMPHIRTYIRHALAVSAMP